MIKVFAVYEVLDVRKFKLRQWACREEERTDNPTFSGSYVTKEGAESYICDLLELYPTYSFIIQEIYE